MISTDIPIFLLEAGNRCDQYGCILFCNYVVRVKFKCFRIANYKVINSRKRVRSKAEIYTKDKILQKVSIWYLEHNIQKSY